MNDELLVDGWTEKDTPSIDMLTDMWLQGKDVSFLSRVIEDGEFEEPYLFYQDISEEDSWNL